MLTGDLPLLLAAPAVGSFVGSLVRRLPAGRPIMLARSACDRCGARLGGRDLIPLLSWAALRGRCRHCGGGVSAFYPAVELTALVLAGWAATVATGTALLFSCLLGWALLALVLLDARHFWLPDVLTLPLLLLGLAAAAWLDPAGWASHALGAALGWAAFAAIGWAYRMVRGREGLGGGDAKLLGAGGAWLGLGALPALVLAAALLGLLLAAITRRERVAFGIPLAVAIWLGWLYGAPG